MGKNKLAKFKENNILPHLLQPSFDTMFKGEHELKNAWCRNFFKNDAPIVVELGCGRGEYTVNLAQRYPEKNFIGVDIKGARLWNGAKQAQLLHLSNVAFIRTHVDFLASIFGEGEISEVWITFPDPFPRRRSIKKRLTSSKFLKFYQSYIKHQGLVHFKTDNEGLFQYTLALLEFNGVIPIKCYTDVHAEAAEDELLSIKTYYENLFMQKGHKINYVCFEWDSTREWKELPVDNED